MVVHRNIRLGVEEEFREFPFASAPQTHVQEHSEVILEHSNSALPQSQASCTVDF